MEYKEDIFVGYRYYEKKKIAPLFPFGFGLSYTNFEYTGIRLDKQEMSENDTLTVTAGVRNAGKTAGREIVELYVADGKGERIRPRKELKGFAKVELQPGEEKQVSLKLGRRAFAYYDTDLHDFHVQDGKFTILVGGSSDSTPLCAEVTVHAEPKAFVFTPDTLVSDVAARDTKGILKEVWTKVKRVGLPGTAGKEYDKIPDFMMDAPLRSMTMMGATYETVDEIVKRLNSEYHC